MSEVPGPGAVPGAFLDYLRGRTGDPGLAFRLEPARLHGGFDTRIYAFELETDQPAWRGPFVARVFRPGEGVRAPYEGAMQAAIAATGFPCPAPVCVEADPGPLGGPFIVMPRLRGVPLLEAALRPSSLLLRLPTILADTHLRLHAIEAEKLLASLEAHELREEMLSRGSWLPHLAAEIDSWSLEGCKPGLRWLQANQPPVDRRAVCHLDFHPLNILFDAGYVTGVIDWAGAAIADPVFDVATSRVIMVMGPVGGGPLRPAFDLVRRWIAERYTAAYRSHSPLDHERLRYYEAVRCFASMVHVGVRRKTGGGDAGGYAWGLPRQVRMMTRHFERISGVPLVLE